MKTNGSILLLFSCLFLTSCNEHPAANEEVVYPVNIETIVFQYPGHCINYPDLQLNADLIAVNSQEEMELWLLKYEGEYPAIDFGKYTLLLLFTKTEFADYQLVQTAEDSYRMEVTFEIASALQKPGVRNRYATLILAPKMQEKPEFNLIFEEIEEGGNEGYPKNIKTIALSYPDTCFTYERYSLYLPVISHIINSREELERHLLRCQECPTVDFDKHTLILILTKTDFNVVYQLVQTDENNYRMDIEFELPYDMQVPPNAPWLWYGDSRRATLILAPKMQGKPEFNLRFKQTTGGGYADGFPKNITTVDFQLSKECLIGVHIFDILSHMYLSFIDSQESLDRILYSGCEEEFPSIDFEKHTLLIVSSYGPNRGSYQLVQTAENTYRMDMAFGVNSLEKKDLPLAVLAPKMQERPEANIIVLNNY